MTRTPTRTPRLLLALPAALLLGLTACSSSSDTTAGESAAPAADVAVEQGFDEEVADSAGGGEGAFDADATASVSRPVAEVREAAIISTGTVSLRAADVGDTRFEVQKVVDRLGGEITDSETRTDEDGGVRDARLVLRVPSADFTEAMDALEKLADLEASSTSSEDVTTQVVDTEVRIRIQRESIRRIEQLLARAGSIRDVVSVERELTQREAELNSLLQQQAYLADQTSFSTIKVHLQRHPEDGGPEPDDEDDAGFLPGLAAGWGALSSVAVGLATAAGALLPFAGAALLVGVPGWVLVRSMSGRRRTSPAAEPAEG